MVVKKLIVDEFNDIFDTNTMNFREFPSVFDQIRAITSKIIAEAPERFKEGNLLEQQLSELIKNGIKHGNKCDPEKKIKIWYSFKKRVRFIVEDEGEGFQNLDNWNEYFKKRQTALYNQDFDNFLQLAAYKGPTSDENDGGNSLIAALEYWNGGMIYSKKRNKVGVIRWYTGGSEIQVF